jgi:hypothetical protein
LSDGLADASINFRLCDRRHRIDEHLAAEQIGDFFVVDAFHHCVEI